MALININSGDINSGDINSGDIKEHIAKAVAALKDGYIIIAPLENSYALVADAFFHDAVRAMHVLRDDRLGIAAQVMVASAQSIDGIAREISSDARALMAEFWPGLLSLNLKPQLGLNWDLGEPLEEIHQRGNGRSRRFSNGWAAINLNTRRYAKVRFSVPEDLYDITGKPAPSKISLMPHEGRLYVRKT